MKILAIDSWPVMAFFRKEAAHIIIKSIFDDAANGKPQLFMSVINLAEVYYKLIRNTTKQEAQESILALKNIPITIISASDTLVFEAAEIKARYPISFGDCFTVAVAQEKKAPILTGDPGFKKVEKIVKIKWVT